MKQRSVYFDGACEPVNPGGTCTWGFVVYDGDQERYAQGGVLKTSRSESTNNVAEWSALIFALKWLLENPKKCSVRIYGDSQLVVKQFTGEWRVNAPHLKRAWQCAMGLAKEIRQPIVVSWVPREQNARADELSKLAYEQATGKPAPIGNEHHKRRSRSRAGRGLSGGRGNRNAFHCGT